MQQAAVDLRARGLYAIPLALGLWAALLSLAPTVPAKLTLAAPLLIIPVCWWSLLQAQRWLLLFLCALAVLPPLPIRLGDSGPHPALLVLAGGLLFCCFQLHQWKAPVGSLTKTLWLFTLSLLVSVGSAALQSGVEIAAGSLLRVLLFAISPFVFTYAASGPGSDSRKSLAFAQMLFRAGAAAALFACLDFYFQFPTPAGFGPQYVWLDEGVFRRAQGFFYEASTLGNFCAFFLVMIFCSLGRPRGQSPCTRLELTGGAVLFSVALVFSYSRGSLLNLLAAGSALVVLQHKQVRRASLTVSAAAVACLVIVYFSFPAFAQSYFSRLSGSLAHFWSTPNGVLSGRLDSWAQLGHFILEQPWQLVLGVGYKTLAYSPVSGSVVITDNTYLSLLIETGVVGLGLFLYLNAKILRTSFLASHSICPTRAFFGRWMFCFWIGEMVQMLSGDLITYWRVLPFYFWVLAQANQAEQGDTASPKYLLAH